MPRSDEDDTGTVTDTTHMTGHLLIAMPTMMDPNFHQTVTYICEHSDLGALGLVINRPLDMGLGEVLEQLSLDSPDETLTAQPVLRGGPVQTERGFVLHESTREWEATTQYWQRRLKLFRNFCTKIMMCCVLPMNGDSVGKQQAVPT